jgi:hypothetical protein
LPRAVLGPGFEGHIFAGIIESMLITREDLMLERTANVPDNNHNLKILQLAVKNRSKTYKIYINPNEESKKDQECFSLFGPALDIKQK